MVTPLQFVLVLVLARPEATVPPTPELPYIFGAAALAVAAVSWFLPAHLLDLKIRATTLERRTEVAQGETMFRHAAPTHEVFTVPFETAFTRVLPGYQTAHILALALSEAILIFGLVIGFLGFELVIAAPFFALGWLLILVRFPRDAPVRKRIEAFHGARFVP
jgi:hypothetical protein